MKRIISQRCHGILGVKFYHTNEIFVLAVDVWAGDFSLYFITRGIYQNLITLEGQYFLGN